MSAQSRSDISKCKLERLKNRRDFLRLRSGKRHASSYMTVQSKAYEHESAPSPCRIGFTVTTKVGNAVERNRIKRRLRSAVSEVFPACGKPGHDYVLIAKRKCLSGPYDAIVRDLQQALDHLHANRAKGSRSHRNYS